jgi:hypothetical protein
MSTLNFPTNPTLNQTYSFGGKTWIWNGQGWALTTFGAINAIPIGNITPSTGDFTQITANTVSANAVTVLGNITAANVNTGRLSLSGNVISQLNVQNSVFATSFSTVGTVRAAGIVSSQGNIIGQYFIGNGAFLTGITAGTSYSNANVDAYLPIYTGNISANSVSLSGNIQEIGRASCRERVLHTV